mmetsp:Transcript_9873/g.38422  ORF Transcript_9873/g.38422 Transcript_9873/m.38422 type:complete len:237 (-) Transcript_9873:34-744(-)
MTEPSLPKYLLCQIHGLDKRVGRRLRNDSGQARPVLGKRGGNRSIVSGVQHAHDGHRLCRGSSTARRSVRGGPATAASCRAVLPAGIRLPVRRGPPRAQGLPRRKALQHHGGVDVEPPDLQPHAPAPGAHHVVHRLERGVEGVHAAAAQRDVVGADAAPHGVDHAPTKAGLCRLAPRRRVTLVAARLCGGRGRGSRGGRGDGGGRGGGRERAQEGLRLPGARSHASVLKERLGGGA